MKKIAVIGAGLAGLTVAKQLHQHAEVTVFEKARGPGGRMTTRRRGDFQFDHGAQFFKAHTDSFQSLITPLLQKDVIAYWEATFAEIRAREIHVKGAWSEKSPHYVGVTGMNALPKYLAKALNVLCQTRVQTMVRQENAWLLYDGVGKHLGAYDWVVAAIPPEQATNLLPGTVSFYDDLTHIQMSGCYSLMLGFKEALPLPFDAALVRDENISWVSVNSSKPGTQGLYSLLVHSTNRWADAHIESDAQWVSDYLRNHLSDILDMKLSHATHQDLHRWRYANISHQQGGQTFFIDEAQGIAACGDWCIQGRVEAAYLSGSHAGEQIARSIKP